MKSVQERVAAGGKLLVPPSRVLLSLLVPLSLPGIVSLEHTHGVFCLLSGELGQLTDRSARLC